VAVAEAAAAAAALAERRGGIVVSEVEGDERDVSSDKGGWGGVRVVI
jgi:hypothetical protein